MPVIPCPSPAPTPTPGVVQFSDTEFVEIYPEFTGISSGAVTNNFTGAQYMLNNSCSSRVYDANERLYLLYLLTAHLTFLQNGTNDGAGNVTPPPGIVGRIASATEGAVSVAAEFNVPDSTNNAYLSQTKYGAQFLQATAKYRTMLYVPAPGGVCGPGVAPWGTVPGYGGTYGGSGCGC